MHLLVLWGRVILVGLEFCKVSVLELFEYSESFEFFNFGSGSSCYYVDVSSKKVIGGYVESQYFSCMFIVFYCCTNLDVTCFEEAYWY